MIKIDNLSYRYSRKIELYNGLSMDLLPGKIYGLLGKNGAGKSTLIKNISGMLFPSTGTCKVFGLQPRHRQVGFLKDIFFVPEESYLPNLSIKDFITIYAPFYPNFDENQFTSYLSDFGIEGSRHLHALSFGQKKKITIGFALSTNTRVLIMDEPTNGLDIPSKITFRNMINDAFHPDRIVIISTHQVRDLDELISSLIVMDKGKVLLHEEKEDIIRRLQFRISEKAVQSDEVLYQERTSNGWATISENHDGAKGYLDIELLFNAVINKAAKVYFPYN